jgi:hypothetical protein
MSIWHIEKARGFTSEHGDILKPREQVFLQTGGSN